MRTRCAAGLMIALLGAACGAPERPVTGPEPAWADRVARGITLAERQPRPDGDRVALTSSSTGLVVHVSDRGATLSPLRDDGSSPVTLRFDGLQRAGALTAFAAPATVGSCIDDQLIDITGACVRQVERRGADVTEWWRSEDAGLRQGWIIDSAPDGDGPLVLRIAVEGARAETLDDTTVRLAPRRGAPMGYQDLVAWDATGRALPARLEAAGSAIRVVVEDAGATWPITVDPIVSVTTPHYFGAANEEVGNTLASVGDVNGDGYDDVLLGAPSSNWGQSNTGGVWVFYGSAAGLGTVSTLIGTGAQQDEQFGASIAGLGDVNGDGYADVAVGAPGWDTTEVDAGLMLIYYGDATGLFSPILREGATAGERLGASVAGLGDIDGDGFADVGAGSPNFEGGSTDVGRARVWFGSSAGIGAVAEYTSTGNNVSQAAFGQAMAGLGDVNGDGFDDFGVGAPGEIGGDGVVHVWFGDAGRTFGASTTVTSPFPASAFGERLAAAGDTNGDGYADILVGAPQHNPGGAPGAGVARLLLGDPNAISAGFPVATDVVGSETNEATGTGLGGLGDINGDGFADWAVGRPGATGSVGVVEVHYGDFGGGAAVSVDLQQASGPMAFGTAVDGGDTNGDGFPEILVGAPEYTGSSANQGALFLYDGGPGLFDGAPTATRTGTQSGEEFGSAVAGVGDVNGDGYEDVLVGAPGFSNGESGEGAVFGFMGSPAGLSTISTWSKESDFVTGALGSSLDRIGDVNGDGYDDVAIGAPGADGIGTNAGMVWLYYGSASGLSITPALSLDGAAANAELGATIVGAGDVNGDGFVDWAATSAGTDTVTWYPGGTGAVSGGSPITAPAATVAFGARMAGGGDVDGDGFDDLLISDSLLPDPNNGSVAAGTVYLYFGSATGLVTSPGWEKNGVAANYELGSDVALTDVNGDGLSDVVAGTAGRPCADGAGCGGFTTFLSTAGVGPGGASNDVAGTQADARLGATLTAAGDVNADGYADVVVGEPLYDGTVGAEGRLHLHLGASTGLTNVAAWDHASGMAAVTMGNALASADVNGDGWPDLVAGGPDVGGGDGQVLVFEGNREDGVTDTVLPPRFVAFDVTSGLSVRPRSGASSANIKVGGALHSVSGRSRLAVEVEMKPLGVPFDGTGTVQGSFSDTVTNGVVFESVPGLSVTTGYHWRARTVEDPARAVFPALGRWQVGGLSGDPAGLHLRTGTIGSNDADGDGWTGIDGDCDDTDPFVYPGAPEGCDGADSDCDGAVPADELDGDADGQSPCAGDCDDGDPAAFLGGLEVCDGKDGDCDGQIDSGVQVLSATGLPTPVPDAGGVQLAFAGTSPLPLSGIVLGFTINHPRVADLTLVLVDPSGGFWSLSEENGGSGENYTQTVIDWSVVSPLITQGSAPFSSGPYGPEQTLVPLIGTSGVGSWFVDVTDADLGDTGVITDFVLELSVDGTADIDGDGVSTCGGDCDESNPNIYAGAPEIQDNGIDEDCDGVDELGPTCGTVDSDGDGVTECDGDCAPLDPTVFPGGNEICDGIDNDCDGAPFPDEVDADGDGWSVCEGDCDDANVDAYPGAPESAAGPDLNCDGVIGDDDNDGDGFTVSTGDCDDSDPAVNPDAAEACDGADTDCDGSFLSDELQDSDADGFLDCADCNALNPAVNPLAVEICDGLDNDCDGYGLPEGELDLDTDGVLACDGDCDDTSADVRPGLPEQCDDGLDNDCDGTVDVDTDEDGDGVGSCQGDCDDTDDDVFPGATEECNGVDDDCDQVIDNGFDEDGDGVSLCAGDCLDTDADVFPGAAEVCDDGLDNDCDPTTQETIDSDGDGYAPCTEPVGDCWEGNPFVHPTAIETCNHLDDNCNGLVDEGLDRDEDGFSPCDFDCDDLLPGVHPLAEEICENGLDDDCDGADEACEQPPPPPVPTDPSCGCESALIGPERAPGWLVGLLGGVIMRRRTR